MRFRINDFNTSGGEPITWDALIMRNACDLWLLTVLDFTHGISHEVTGSTYITAEDAWQGAYLAVCESKSDR
jgi:hypothetical protein